MEKLSPMLAEWGSMKFLISEILLCLLAASILGLIIGWLCKGAFARDKLKHREAAWQRKYKEQDDNYRQQVSGSEQKFADMQSRFESNEAEKLSLNSSLEANKSAVHKAHIEVQQLSKRQRDTQDRLQKIIIEKDKEISRLQQESAQGKNTPPRPVGFSSRKPSKPETPTARPQQQPQREQPGSTPNPGTTQAGGRPNVQPIDPGYKPGTQTVGDDLDKTQVLGSEADRSRTAPVTPLSQPTEPTAAPTSGRETVDPQNRPAANSQQTQAGNHTDNTPNRAANTPGSQPAPNTTTQGRRRKRSLWDRVKSTVTKKDD